MPRIIPAILTLSAEELRKRVELVAPFVDLVQIDVMDGIFVSEVSFGEPNEIARTHLPVKFEVHLMINNPEESVEDWIRAGASRIIIHAEAEGNLGLAIETAKKYDRETGIALNPETPVSKIKDWLEFARFIQLMGVNPGAMGREFHENIYDKIEELKKLKPGVRLAVDGGVSEENIARLARAGVEDLVAGSAIFNKKNPIEALKGLQTKLTGAGHSL